MRILAVLTAITVKSFLRFWIMSPRDRVLWAIALAAAIALMAAILTEKQERISHPPELFCPDLEAGNIGMKFLCEFKLRSA